MNFESEIIIKALPKEVFELYEDVAKWSAWDPDVLAIIWASSSLVSFTGFLAPIFGRLIGSGIKKGLPNTLNGLKVAVESKS